MTKHAEVQKKYKHSIKGKLTQSRYYRSQTKKNAKWREYHLYGGKLKSRIKNLKAFYGLSIDDFETILAKQNNKCECCGIDFRYVVRTPCIDHDHKTGKVRGLLCTNCNLGIGNFHDDISQLQKGIEYLLKFQRR